MMGENLSRPQMSFSYWQSRQFCLLLCRNFHVLREEFPHGHHEAFRGRRHVLLNTKCFNIIPQKLSKCSTLTSASPASSTWRGSATLRALSRHVTFFSALEAAPVATSAALRALPGHVALFIALEASHLTPSLRAVTRYVALFLTLEAGHLAGATTLGTVAGHVTVLVAFEACHLRLGWTVAFGVALLFSKQNGFK